MALLALLQDPPRKDRVLSPRLASHRQCSPGAMEEEKQTSQAVIAWNRPRAGAVVLSEQIMMI